MPKTRVILAEPAQSQLVALGQRLRLARERRKLGTQEFSQSVDIARDTLRRLEKGDPTIAMGTYLNVLQALGLGTSLDLLASSDATGHQLQDQALLGARRAQASV